MWNKTSKRPVRTRSGGKVRKLIEVGVWCSNCNSAFRVRYAHLKQFKNQKTGKPCLKVFKQLLMDNPKQAQISKEVANERLQQMIAGKTRFQPVMKREIRVQGDSFEELPDPERLFFSVAAFRKRVVCSPK